MKQVLIKLIFSVFVMLTMLTACVTSPPPRLDAGFGGALEGAKIQQTFNLNASHNTEPVLGIDGQAADASFDNYRNSFINPPVQVRGQTGFGSSGNGGSTQGGGR